MIFLDETTLSRNLKNCCGLLNLVRATFS